ncbi:MAG: hypothetical protein KAH84_10170 [Thiomargarita sp.]|nr:hypothetical protein [Thiomargarita sp.]
METNFTQLIKLEWLNLTVNYLLHGNNHKKISEALFNLLNKQQITPAQQQQIINIIIKTWVKVPKSLTSFRNEGLILCQQLPKKERFAVHWIMLMVTLPFFTLLAKQIGRLLHLQPQVEIKQVQKRVFQELGEQSNIETATNNIIACWLEWGLLFEVEKNIFAITPPKLIISNQRLITWLIEGLLIAHKQDSISLDKLNHIPELFPFNVLISYLTPNERLDTFTQGVNELNATFNHGYFVKEK